jgi:hypothetical protein
MPIPHAEDGAQRLLDDGPDRAFDRLSRTVRA